MNVVIAIGISCLILFTLLNFLGNLIYIGNYPNSSSSEQIPLTLSDIFDKCPLPIIDPWDRDILKYFEPEPSFERGCQNFDFLTDWSSFGIISMSKQLEHMCYGRCLEYEKERTLKYGKWIPLNDEPNYNFTCEFVETICDKSGTTNVTKAKYGMIHTQFIEKNDEIPLVTNQTSFNIFVILIDSQAHSQSQRGLGTTLHYMEKSMKSITFPHLNKVGVNSAPNAQALFLGRSAEKQDRTVFGLPNVPPEMDVKLTCDTSVIGDEKLIFNKFKNAGYRTLIGDDWMSTAIGWPDCAAFTKQITDHILQPIPITTMNSSNSAVHAAFHIENYCQTKIYRMFLDFFGKFAESYKDNPKFGWIWLNSIGHDHYSGTSSFDAILYKFLLDHKDTFDNSFFFLISDHGPRFGRAMSTKVGSIDVNNPMVVVTVPRVLRNSQELIETMKSNAQQLQTHFDTRATMLDILLYQPESRFRNRSYFQIPGEKGSSFLREQPGPRSCNTLPIPFQYCICQYPLEEIDTNSGIAIRIGMAVFDDVNFSLRLHNLTSTCPPWTFGKITSIASYVPVNVTKTYKVTVSPDSPYSGAQFTTTASLLENGTIAVGIVDRLDQYGSLGDCVSPKYRTLCHCGRRGR